MGSKEKSSEAQPASDSVSDNRVGHFAVPLEKTLTMGIIVHDVDTTSARG